MVSSETSLSGKLFVEFIALIYLSYIKKQMQDNNLFKDYTMQQVLDKLDVIECFTVVFLLQSIPVNLSDPFVLN